MILSYYNKKYETIYDVLKNEFKISNRLMTKLKKEQNIYLNKKISPSWTPIKYNDLIEIDLSFPEKSENIVPIKMNLSILYEDNSLLILNKQHGIPVHPSILHYENSLSNGVQYYFNTINLSKKIRPVNRLDKDTSGIVIFAKNEYIQECLIRQMQDDTFKKEYIAICEGIFDEKRSTINAKIARKDGSIIERCISPLGEEAITHYEVLYCKNNISIVKCMLETGRTHQIRLHMSYIGHPILGDTLYGSPSNLISRQALHSYKISFIHPIDKKQIILTCPIPKDMNSILKQSL